MVSEAQTRKRPVALGIFLIIAGVIGWGAAFALTLDKFDTLLHPQAALSCDFSVLVQCSKNLGSAQGSLFGFPNPLIGLGAWVAPIVVGAALLAGARFDRWFWLLFNLGVLGALALVVFLIATSLFVLHTLCPWCMVTWAVTIPTFWAVTLRNLSTGTIPVGLRGGKIAKAAYGWVGVITLVSYVVVAILAQFALNLTDYL